MQMDRGRGRGRATKKRTTLPSHSHFHASSTLHQSTFPSQPPDLVSPSTPLSAATVAGASAGTLQQRVPGTAPVRGAKSRAFQSVLAQRTTSPTSDLNLRGTPRTDRPARSATFTPSFSLESPSSAATAMAGGLSARKRARTFDATPDGSSAYDDGISKGGHTLRKRARVDYTQEQIDDEHTPAGGKTDATSRTAVTPSARARKKRQTHDGFDEDGDNFNSSSTAQKRRRPEKSPAPSRGGTARRRPQSRKSTTEISTYHVDQSLEDEVQDTILVGFPTGEDLESEEEDSDESNSFDESETRPSSSDGSDTAMAQADAEPATPKQQTSPQVDRAVSLVSETQEPIENTLIADQPNGKPEIVPEPIEVPLQPKEPDEPHPEHKAEEIAPKPAQTETAEIKLEEPPKPDIPSPAEPQSPKIQPDAEPQPVVEPPEAAEPDTSAVEPKPQPETQPEEPAPTPEPEAKPLSESSTPSATPLVDIALRVRRGSTASSRRARTTRSTEPIRLKALEKIHNSPTPFGTELRLTPYEADDVVHPGTYTEWVRPEAKDRVEMTPMPTPAPTPSPVDMALLETRWDGQRPLKKSEFFELYRQETKRREERGEPRISMAEFNNQCVRRYKASHHPGTGRSTPSADSVKMPGPKSMAPKRPTLLTSASFDDTPHGSQADSQQPTAAPSPAALDEEEPQMEVEADDAEEELETGEPETAAKAGGPAGPIEVTRNPARQFIFPKLRDPQEFVDAMEDWQKMEPGKLYATVAAAVEAMHAYQVEYNELKKIVDDEENAKRRIANDKTIVNWENRQKMDEPTPWRRHFDEPVKGPPVFEVRGARAPKPYIDDPVLEHQREEDKIMAQAYGFKHNAHPTQVGRQNPEEQRWENAENRLRERKKTEKGAELAEENVIEGKRMRKPRNLSDQSKEPSRSGTPIGAMSLPGRRFRRKFTTKDDDDTEGQDVQPEPEPIPAPVVRRRRGGFRGGRGGQTTIEQFYAPPTTSASQADCNQSDEEMVDEKPGSARKRGRGLAPPPPPAVSENNSFKSKRRDAKAEIASSSFYSNVSADSQAESRPSTASSAATVNTEETGESTYSLRDKRKRNFALENDPELEARPQKRTRGIMLPKLDGLEQQQKKRTPRRKTTATSQPPMAEEPPAPAPMAAAPMPAPVHAPAPSPAPPFLAPQPVGGLQAPLFFSNPPPAIAPAPGPYLHTFSAAPAFPPGGNPPPPAAPPAVKKPITKIKLTNNGPSSQNSSRAATPANIAPNPVPKIITKSARGAKGPDSGLAKPATSNGSALDEKPYAEMSKSEKMSWSMRRRWASGEMQGAVEKRRTTLANKKAEKAAVTPTANNSDSGAPGHMTDPGSTGASASGTPTPIPMPMPMPGPLAMPGQNQPIQPLQQPHGLLPPQGMVGYYPHGGPAM
ncbi:hypothetical protein B0T16DRAFT_489004 [Cercophora newfieldiana]|uniref:Uncharacterized protein n=1 Tax=Cercophora newfieldiana TaxID=92897 RepID=A0AA40D155_9PEZI|nr:hypothetical protein B0T16DRAFT_489004 [Cercophora newfieldiana]